MVTETTGFFHFIIFRTLSEFSKWSLCFTFGPINSWQIDGEKIEVVTDFIFLGSKNHCRWWLQPWNLRYLPLRRNAMTNLVKVKVAQSCPTLCGHMDCTPWNSPGQNTGVGSLFLLQGIFPTQGSPQVSHTAGRFFTSWATREAREYWSG